MKKQALYLVCASTIVLAGCTGGTTYGTGTSHEEATLKSMYNMLSIRPEKAEAIDYSARPDLVMPSSKETLPSPDSAVEQADGQAWPVSPEQRIAEVRGAIPDAGPRNQLDRQDSTLPIEFQQAEKQGIQNSAGLYTASRSVSRNGSEPDFIGNFTEANSASAEVKRRRDELSYSTGPQRKFLTEPPAQYRVPAQTADAGDLGIDSDVVEARKLAERQARIDAERGVVPVAGAE